MQKIAARVGSKLFDFVIAFHGFAFSGDAMTMHFVTELRPAIQNCQELLPDPRPRFGKTKERGHSCRGEERLTTAYLYDEKILQLLSSKITDATGTLTRGTRKTKSPA